MPSPFPGMDPYLEDPLRWGQFHGGMTVAIAAELNRLLPSRYLARFDRYLYGQDVNTQTSVLLGESDSYGTGPEQSATVASVRTVTAPATVVWPVRRRLGNRYVRVMDRSSRRVVTAIELLSPANKKGNYRRAYRRKRNEYIARGVNLVEIGLLRAGRRMPLGQPTPPRTDYYVLVCRPGETPVGGVWPFSVRDLFPPVHVPLDPGVADVLLPLRACMDRVYDESRFVDEIDYTQPPVPPLTEPDATWAREFLEQVRACRTGGRS